MTKIGILDNDSTEAEVTYYYDLWRSQEADKHYDAQTGTGLPETCEQCEFFGYNSNKECYECQDRDGGFEITNIEEIHPKCPYGN